MAADRVDILLEQGSDFSIVVDLKTANGSAWDLTGYTHKAAVRQNYADASPILTLTTATLSPATDGRVQISATKTATAAIPTSFLLGVWEFDVISPTGTQFRIYQGLARNIPQATR